MTARADDDPGVSADDNPGVIAQPPYIFLCFLALGFGLDAAWPFGLGLAGAQVPGGVALLALGLLIATLALRQFARAGTSYQTRNPASALISRGLYRHSRNPVYIGLIVVYAGIGVAVDNPWILGLGVPARSSASASSPARNATSRPSSAPSMCVTSRPSGAGYSGACIRASRSHVETTGGVTNHAE